MVKLSGKAIYLQLYIPSKEMNKANQPPQHSKWRPTIICELYFQILLTLFFLLGNSLIFINPFSFFV